MNMDYNEQILFYILHLLYEYIAFEKMNDMQLHNHTAHYPLYSYFLLIIHSLFLLV